MSALPSFLLLLQAGMGRVSACLSAEGRINRLWEGSRGGKVVCAVWGGVQHRHRTCLSSSQEG